MIVFETKNIKKYRHFKKSEFVIPDSRKGVAQSMRDESYSLLSSGPIRDEVH
jgi:hypothetical protein